MRGKAATLAKLLGRTGLRRTIRHAVRWAGVLCLNYHRIGRDQGSPFDHALWSASQDDFDAQVRQMKRNCEVLSPDQLPDALRHKSGRNVLITFDDGYIDNYAAAFPVLRAHSVPATFFVTTGFLDSRLLAWWDEIAWIIRTSKRSDFAAPPWLPEPLRPQESADRAIRTALATFKSMPQVDNQEFLSLLAERAGVKRYQACDGSTPWMTWDMIREMRRAGMTIGGHTVTHPILAQMPEDQQRQEVLQCGRRLQEELGEPMRFFSYPVGGRKSFTAETRRCLRDAGVQYAFSYYGGMSRFEDWDNFDIRRVPIESHISRDLFAAIVDMPYVFCR